MKLRTRSLSALLTLLFCLLSACNGPSSDPAKNSEPGGAAPKAAGGETFRLALLTWVGYGPIYLAKEKNFYDGINVEIELIEDTSARRAALTSGDVQGSTDIVDSFTNALAAGLPAKAVLKIDDSMGGDGIVVKKEIGSIKDLKGHTIAFADGQPSHFFLLKLLEDAGLTTKDIIPRPVEAADQAGNAFVSGSVDAAVTWEPNLTQASRLPNAKILTTSREQPGLIVDIFTIRNEYLEKKPEVIKAFLQGWFKAVEYWKQNPDDANQIMAKALKLKTDEFKRMIGGIRYSDLPDNHDFFKTSDSGGSKFLKLAGVANQIWSREGVIKKSVDPKKADGSSIVMSLSQ